MNRDETKNLLLQLTATPSPPIPPGLEARLVAIGAADANGRRGRRGRHVAATLAACIALAAAGLAITTNMWRGRNAHVATTTTQPALTSAPAMTGHDDTALSPPALPVMTARSTRVQETRLCDIFPPLPPPL
jgi:hypothetical protein